VVAATTVRDGQMVRESDFMRWIIDMDADLSGTWGNTSTR
jgi:hypothetical protein